MLGHINIARDKEEKEYKTVSANSVVVYYNFALTTIRKYIGNGEGLMTQLGFIGIDFREKYFMKKHKTLN